LPWQVATHPTSKTLSIFMRRH